MPRPSIAWATWRATFHVERPHAADGAGPPNAWGQRGGPGQKIVRLRPGKMPRPRNAASRCAMFHVEHPLPLQPSAPFRGPRLLAIR